MRSLESCLCQITVLFPKVLTTGLYTYALWVFEVHICLQKGGVWYPMAAFLDVVLFTYGLYTYFAVIRVGCGSPLDFDELRQGDEASIGSIQPPSFIVQRSVQVKASGSLRFCNKCKCWKPDRTHHCSSCNICQLKLDHHCPWFATCVGFNNYKYFIQFLICTIAYSSLNLLVSTVALYTFFRDEKFQDEFIGLNVIMLGVLSLTMSISVTVFSGMTIYFLLRNLTTIEQMEQVRYRNNMEVINDSYYGVSQKPTSETLGNAFDLGWRRNWKEVMGNNWKEWIMPVENHYHRMDFYDNRGVYYDVDQDVLAKLQRNTKLQQQLLEQLRGIR